MRIVSALFVAGAAAEFHLRGATNSSCLKMGETCALDGSLPDCCEGEICWEYMMDGGVAQVEWPGLSCTSCLAPNEACSRNIVSGTPCCKGYICGVSDDGDKCVKMPETVVDVAPMGDDDTNSTKCGCPDGMYCPGPPLPNPNGNCSWLGAQGFSCGTPAGSACQPDP